MQYTWQLYYKQKQVEDHLKRIGKFDMPELMPIIPAAEDRYYRNKLEFSFSNKRWLDQQDMERQSGGDPIQLLEMNALGFHIPGRFDKVLDIDKCYLQEELSNAIRTEIKSYALQNKLSFFDIKQQKGLLRTIILRNTTLNEWMLIVNFGYDDSEQIKALLSHISDKFSQITSLQYVINEKRNDTITDQQVLVFKGDSFITEQMKDLKFKIGPKSFFQTNTLQAIKLYDVVVDFAALKGNELVYDLYTGTGTIANYIARKAKKVIGVEYVPEAIDDARINSSINAINNTIFFAGDMKEILNDDFIHVNGQPDVIITDPPRAGMHPDVVNKLIAIAANRIVYVSCNSATQARDLAMLDAIYKVEKIQPVDMFPHTHHVENVILLLKR